MVSKKALNVKKPAAFEESGADVSGTINGFSVSGV